MDPNSPQRVTPSRCARPNNCPDRSAGNAALPMPHREHCLAPDTRCWRHAPGPAGSGRPGCAGIQRWVRGTWRQCWLTRGQSWSPASPGACWRHLHVEGVQTMSKPAVARKTGAPDLPADQVRPRHTSQGPPSPTKTIQQAQTRPLVTGRRAAGSPADKGRGAIGDLDGLSGAIPNDMG